MLPQITASKKVFFTTLLTKIGICLLILLPFLLANQFLNFLNVFTVAINYFPFVSLHAYNLWYLLFPFKDPMNISDTLLFLGITYKAWGHFLFLIYSIGIILPLIAIIKKQFNRSLKVSFNKRELEIILLCCVMLPLIFFFFNTQMHERYGHPAIIFAGAYAILSRKYILFILLSVAMVLNMEGLIYYFQLPQYWYKHSLIFNERFIALIYLIAIIIGFWQLYESVKSKDMLVD